LLRRFFSVILALSLFAGPGYAATKKSAPATRKAASRKQPATKRGGAAPQSRTRTATAPVRQQTPTPERYREIQQALADKGFYKGEIDGRWTAECVASLKQFQQEQNLNPDGKLGALSLIALGLGPKHESSAAIPADLSSSSESDQ
jgi:peptidoglycan hydrolase-like protein with peptidoglycan-binding domain